MHLDMATALLFTAMVSLVNAAAMALLALRDPSTYLRDWAISFFLVVTGVAIIGMMNTPRNTPRKGNSRWKTMAAAVPRTSGTATASAVK